MTYITTVKVFITMSPGLCNKTFQIRNRVHKMDRFCGKLVSLSNCRRLSLARTNTLAYCRNRT
jgi:hypothetical protein